MQLPLKRQMSLCQPIIKEILRIFKFFCIQQTRNIFEASLFVTDNQNGETSKSCYITYLTNQF